MHTLTELHALLKQYRIAPRQQLGQHFLIDPATVMRLVHRMGLTSQDTLVEVGPGFGALTLAMAPLVRQLIAVEYDRVLAHALHERLGGVANVEVRHADILKVALPARCRVVGAIPYSITSPLLEHLMRQQRQLQDAWLIIQREVAERLVAAPGSKDYSRLSCFASYHFTVALGPRILRRAFHPQPHVESVFVHLAVRSRPPVQVADQEQLFAVIKAAFAHRRKTLLNNLLPLAGGRAHRAAFAAHLRGAGCDPRQRGETLSLGEFANLASVVASFRH